MKYKSKIRWQKKIQENANGKETDVAKLLQNSRPKPLNRKRAMFYKNKAYNPSRKLKS